MLKTIINKFPQGVVDFIEPYQALPEKNPIIIYTPRKVGSTTISHTLREMGVKLYKHHCLNQDRSLEFQQQLENAGEPVPHWLSDGVVMRKRLNRWIEKNGRSPQGRCKVITLVKDPISIGLSDIFMHIFEFFPEYVNIYDLTNVDNLNDLCKRIFLGDKSVRHDYFSQFLMGLTKFPLHWYDSELNSVFGVDVLETKQNLDCGYATYSGPCADVLLMRIEDVNEYAVLALNKFLGLSISQINTRNVTKRKANGNLYADLKKMFKLPKDYVDSLYHSSYLPYFYSKEEIEGFKRLWT